MNNQILKNQYAGFKLNDTLATNLKFSGVFRVWDVGKRWFDSFDGGENPYWIIRDEYGAKLSCYNEQLATSLVINERYAVEGEIKIGKGATFLNLKKAVVLNGKDFTTTKE